MSAGGLEHESTRNFPEWGISCGQRYTRYSDHDTVIRRVLRTMIRFYADALQSAPMRFSALFRTLELRVVVVIGARSSRRYDAHRGTPVSMTSPCWMALTCPVTQGGWLARSSCFAVLPGNRARAMLCLASTAGTGRTGTGECP